MPHTCHLRGCSSRCPPRHLYCGKHWAMVPKADQRQVYATVRQRGRHVDKTWAPRWRAQAEAEAAVLRSSTPNTRIGSPRSWRTNSPSLTPWREKREQHPLWEAPLGAQDQQWLQRTPKGLFRSAGRGGCLPIAPDLPGCPGLYARPARVRSRRARPPTSSRSLRCLGPRRGQPTIPRPVGRAHGEVQTLPSQRPLGCGPRYTETKNAHGFSRRSSAYLADCQPTTIMATRRSTVGPRLPSSSATP